MTTLLVRDALGVAVALCEGVAEPERDGVGAELPDPDGVPAAEGVVDAVWLGVGELERDASATHARSTRSV